MKANTIIEDGILKITLFPETDFEKVIVEAYYENDTKFQPAVYALADQEAMSAVHTRNHRISIEIKTKNDPNLKR